MVQTSMIDLRKEWSAFVEPKHVGWTWRMLEALYSEPHRIYHTMDHVATCINLWDQTPDKLTAVKVALFLHDVVYVPGDPRNEELSANLLRSLSPIRLGDWNGAHAAVCATCHHLEVVSDKVSQYTVDIDLAILGSNPIAYEQYVAGVRQEYQHVQQAIWRMARGGFLLDMMARKHIYQTEWARDLFEATARANMTNELSMLDKK